MAGREPGIGFRNPYFIAQDLDGLVQHDILGILAQFFSRQQIGQIAFVGLQAIVGKRTSLADERASAGPLSPVSRALFRHPLPIRDLTGFLSVTFLTSGGCSARPVLALKLVLGDVFPADTENPCSL
jgi:hypothetical protein